MMVGVCRIELRLPENHSLKGKRQVVQSIIARLHNKFEVAVAEVDNNDVWQIASLGVACVSSSGTHANEVLSNVVRFIESTRPDLEMLDYEIEILQGL
jgi:uncharacterized protein YlxP (DUF503 family)